MELEDMDLLPDPTPLHRIGIGNCGSVWGTLALQQYSQIPIVLKREDASPHRDIANEVFFQSQIHDTYLSRTMVPRCFGLIPEHDASWKRLLPLLPDGSKACRAMISEKIEPLSRQAQSLLFMKYGPEGSLQKEIELGNGEREHCLARIYLGRRRQSHSSLATRRPRFLKLRNFVLHLDQAEELGLPCKEYAKGMAEALATLHWKIRTNAADVEFVLGAPRAWDSQRVTAERRPTTISGNNAIGEHSLWMLDFDCCTPITADETGLVSIAKAFWRNDPYFPRPDSACESDRELWEIFSVEYQRVANEILQAHPWHGENDETLRRLVRDAISKIVETKGKWDKGVYF